MLTGITGMCTFSIPQRPLLNHPLCKPPTCLQVLQECVPFHPSAYTLLNHPFCKSPTCLQVSHVYTLQPSAWTIGPSFLYTTNMITGETGIFTYLHEDHQHSLQVSKHCNENPIYVFPEMKLRSLVSNYYIILSVSNLYISRIGPYLAAASHDLC
jgi:hypothetical protein